MALGAEERRDKLRKAAERSTYPVTRRCLNGETRQEKLLSSIRQFITYGGEPGELKHLSTRRKRKQKERKVPRDFLSSGERTGKSPNRSACIPGFGPQTVFIRIAEWFWESQPERVKAPYAKSE